MEGRIGRERYAEPCLEIWDSGLDGGLLSKKDHVASQCRLHSGLLHRQSGDKIEIRYIIEEVREMYGRWTVLCVTLPLRNESQFHERQKAKAALSVSLELTFVGQQKKK